MGLVPIWETTRGNRCRAERILFTTRHLGWVLFPVLVRCVTGCERATKNTAVNQPPHGHPRPLICGTLSLEPARGGKSSTGSLGSVGGMGGGESRGLNQEGNRAVEAGSLGGGAFVR